MNGGFRRVVGLNTISAALGATLALCAQLSCGAERAPPNDAPTTKIAVVPEPTESPRYLKDEHQGTSGTVLIAGRPVGYQAEAGILVVHVKDPLDDDPPPPRDEKGGPPPPQPPEAGMSYVAYFRGDKEDSRRPITFLYNGGPGSSTVWLHMGAFGPKRVVTADDSHSPAAPYRIIDNDYTLLDVSDLVFIDAPGTGFGHLRGTDKERPFTASIRMRMRSPISSLNSCRGTTAGIRPSIYSAKVMAPRARPRWRAFWKMKNHWI